MGKKAITTLVIVIIIIAVVALAAIWNQPHVDVQHAAASKTNADQLYELLSKNDSNAKAYLNKIVGVSGKIKSLSVNQQGQQIVLLETADPQASVNCTMEEKLMKAEKGDSVLLKGVCVGYMGGDEELAIAGDVYLTRCYPVH